MSTSHQSTKRGRVDLLSTPVMRTAAWTIAALLLIGYATGEEVQHIHALLGYGLAAVVVAAISWELITAHQHRSAGVRTGLVAARAALTSQASSPIGGPALIASTLMILVGGLALVALAMLWLTHSFWTAVAIDEAHEAIAYLSLGLAIFYVAMVIVGSSQRALRVFRFSRRRAR